MVNSLSSESNATDNQPEISDLLQQQSQMKGSEI